MSQNREVIMEFTHLFLFFIKFTPSTWHYPNTCCSILMLDIIGQIDEKHACGKYFVTIEEIGVEFKHDETYFISLLTKFQNWLYTELINLEFIYKWHYKKVSWSLTLRTRAS